MSIAGLGPPPEGRTPPLARILCAARTVGLLDGAADFAGLLATRAGAELRLFHAVDVRAAPDALDVSHAERSLDAVAGRLRRLYGRVRVSTAITVGDPEDELVRHARLSTAGLVIVAVDRGGSAADILARRLAEETGRPVLAWIEEGCGAAR